MGWEWGRGFRCTQFCLSPRQPSNTVEEVAIWAGTRDPGLCQVVFFEQTKWLSCCQVCCCQVTLRLANTFYPTWRHKASRPDN
eukprot:1156029-Pelagomonas_calceolata.AAC.5